MSSVAMSRLRSQLKRLVAVKGVSDAAFARAMGHKPSWASMVLSGKRDFPIKKIDKAASFFGVDVSVFFARDPLRQAGGIQGTSKGGSLDAGSEADLLQQLEVERRFRKAITDEVRELLDRATTVLDREHDREADAPTRQKPKTGRSR